MIEILVTSQVLWSTPSPKYQCSPPGNPLDLQRSGLLRSIAADRHLLFWLSQIIELTLLWACLKRRILMIVTVTHYPTPQRQFQHASAKVDLLYATASCATVRSARLSSAGSTQGVLASPRPNFWASRSVTRSGSAKNASKIIRGQIFNSSREARYSCQKVTLKKPLTKIYHPSDFSSATVTTMSNKLSTINRDKKMLALSPVITHRTPTIRWWLKSKPFTSKALKNLAKTAGLQKLIKSRWKKTTLSFNCHPYIDQSANKSQMMASKTTVLTTKWTLRSLLSSISIGTTSHMNIKMTKPLIELDWKMTASWLAQWDETRWLIKVITTN